MKKLLKLSVVSLSLVGSSFALDLAEDVKVKVELRPRWERADVKDNNLDTADSLTARIRVGTEFVNLFKVKDLSLFFEPWVVAGIIKDYSPEKQGYDLVADPEQTRINQVFVRFKKELFDLKVGRQMITFDNHRFIGNVGWRQMAQTYDAVRLDLKFIKGLDITGVYVAAKTGVTTQKAGEDATWVFAPQTTQIGEDTPVNDSLLFRVNYKLEPFKSNVTVYAYLLNGLHDTYGVKVNGKPELFTNFQLGFWAEYAYQKDPTLSSYDVNDKNIGASYYYLALKPAYKTGVGKFMFEVGYEFLEAPEAGETTGFTTPLATLHGHNGWADVFLQYTGRSNTYGLEDFRVGGGFQNKLVGKIYLRYHMFSADESFPGGGDKFGDEIDVIYTKKILKNLTFGAKAAFYNADDEASNAGVGANDVTKYWVWITYKWSM